MKYPPVKLVPNDPHWKLSANIQLIKLQEIVGDKEGACMVQNIEGTWKEIYESIKILADLAKKQIELRKCLKCGYEFSGRSWDACPECVKAFNDLSQPVHIPNAIMPKGRGASWDDHEIHAYTVDGS